MHKYLASELQYMIGMEIQIVLGNTVGTFIVHGLLDSGLLYGVTFDTSSGSPHYVPYIRIISAPEYDKFKASKLFKLVKHV